MGLSDYRSPAKVLKPFIYQGFIVHKDDLVDLNDFNYSTKDYLIRSGFVRRID